MKPVPYLMQLVLVAWMALSVFVYALVTISVDSPLAAAIPDVVMHLRNIVYPFFYSKSSL